MSKNESTCEGCKYFEWEQDMGSSYPMCMIKREYEPERCEIFEPSKLYRMYLGLSKNEGTTGQPCHADAATYRRCIHGYVSGRNEKRCHDAAGKDMPGFICSVCGAKNPTCKHPRYCSGCGSKVIGDGNHG